MKPVILLSSLLLTVIAPAQSPLANATVLIIRHAEKPADGVGLTPAGEARANAYVGYFNHLKLDGKPFRVDHLFASTDTKKSHRERLTLAPFSQARHMPIDLRFKNGKYEDLVKDVESHAYGKDILICWHHGNIPAMASAFGAPSGLIPGDKWPDQTFDRMVELRFDGSGKLIESKVLNEHLMPGDK